MPVAAERLRDFDPDLVTTASRGVTAPEEVDPTGPALDQVAAQLRRVLADIAGASELYLRDRRNMPAIRRVAWIGESHVTRKARVPATVPRIIATVAV